MGSQLFFCPWQIVRHCLSIWFWWVGKLCLSVIGSFCLSVVCFACVDDGSMFSGVFVSFAANTELRQERVMFSQIYEYGDCHVLFLIVL